MAENTGKKSPQLLFAEAAKIARFPAGSMWPDELSEKQLICLMSGVWMGDDCKQKEVYTGLIDSAIRQGSLKFRNIEKPIRKRRRVINSANHSSPLYFSNLPHNSPPHMETSQTRAIKFVDRQSVADWLKTSEEQPTEHITEWLRTGEVNTDEANSESKLIIDRANKIKEILSTKYSDIIADRHLDQATARPIGCRCAVWPSPWPTCRRSPSRCCSMNCTPLTTAPPVCR
jgi:hypothetical protein